MVARAWSSQQGVTSQYLWLPQERVMVLQGRTKASLSRSSLTPRRGAGRPGSNSSPGLGFPHLYSEGWTSLSEREDPSLRISSSLPPKSGQQSPWVPLGRKHLASCSSQVSWPVSL